MTTSTTAILLCLSLNEPEIAACLAHVNHDAGLSGYNMRKCSRCGGTGCGRCDYEGNAYEYTETPLCSADKGDRAPASGDSCLMALPASMLASPHVGYIFGVSKFRPVASDFDLTLIWARPVRELADLLRREPGCCHGVDGLPRCDIITNDLGDRISDLAHQIES